MSVRWKSRIRWTGVAVAPLLLILAGPWGVAAQTTSVQVVNTPRTAVPVMPAPAEGQLYRSECLAGFNGGAAALCTLQAPPAGHTLFVETISISTGTESDVAAAGGIFYPTALNDSHFALPIPMIPQFPNANSPSLPNSSVGLASVRAWVKPTVQPSCQVLLTGNSTGAMVCVVFGYLAPAH